MNRRDFIASATAGVACACGAKLSVCAESPEDKPYQRVNTDWLSKCRFGVGVHWTAQTAPRKGKPLPFQKAVDAFRVDRFVDAVAQSGADYVLFTTTHALQMLPAPHPVLDKILPGRTCQRDLIDELAQALAAKNVRLLLYYNHSCNGNDDPNWAKAVGYYDAKKDRLVDNLCQVIAWMGERYGEKVKAWWFDSSYSLDPRGPHNSVTTDMRGFQFPWEKYAAAAKTGFAGRLITFNAGVNAQFLYTKHQDYWSGETNDLETPAKSRYLANGLQWFGWTCLDTAGWVHAKTESEIPPPLYPDAKVIDYVRRCNRNQSPMTFNVGIYQDGELASASVDQLHRLKTALEDIKTS